MSKLIFLCLLSTASVGANAGELMWTPKQRSNFNYNESMARQQHAAEKRLQGQYERQNRDYNPYSKAQGGKLDPNASRRGYGNSYNYGW